MARKDQRKFFYLACLSDEAFIEMFRQKHLPIKVWAWLNAIKRRRDRLREYLYATFKGDLGKELAITSKKAEEFFEDVKKSKKEFDVRYYLNFLLALGDDIWSSVRNRFEFAYFGKILEHLFNIYLYFDPEINAESYMDEALKDLDLIEKYF
ncbi:MAG: hypothetical protein DRH57_00205 [Candidatus Cloacimonadota bacterium]|nr:MAG: hypothetical protein DRH57_00205 [Candidatus Cloacimonadota bacterium]